MSFKKIAFTILFVGTFALGACTPAQPTTSPAESGGDNQGGGSTGQVLPPVVNDSGDTPSSSDGYPAEGGENSAGYPAPGGGSTGSSQPGSAGSLAGTSWTLVEFGDPVTPLRPLPDTQITLEIGDGELGGSAGCNHYGGGFVMDGDTIQLTQMFSTLMACADPAMAQEAVYMGLVQAATKFRLEEGRLILESGESVLVYEAAQAASLEGTEWGLSGMVEGDAVVSSNLDENITAIFEGGQIAGSAGCNRYFAGYAVDGNAITFSPAGSTRMMCAEDVMAREQQFLSALEQVASFEITRESLSFYDANGSLVMSFFAK